MNKNIGSRVSWRTTFAVAAVALASVFTAWGGDIERVTDQLYLGTAVWDTWTSAYREGKAVDYNRAVVYFYGGESVDPIFTLDTSDTSDLNVSSFSPDGKTIAGYNLTRLVEGWNSAAVEKYYVEVYNDVGIVAATDKLPFSSVYGDKILQDEFEIEGYGFVRSFTRTVNIASPVVAPEPTSGLLLGVAGLALKRRRQVA